MLRTTETATDKQDIIFTGLKKQAIVLLMGNFNAKLGIENEGLEENMGDHQMGLHKNQIDCNAITKKWRGSMFDTRSRRVADVGSDNHLMVA